MLLGLKGAGKTTLGSLLERRFPLSFVRAEPIWIAHGKLPRGADWDRRGYRKVAAAIRHELESHDGAVVETTGAAPWTVDFLDEMRAFATVRLVRVVAPLAVCAERVRTRDTRDHIAVSDARVAEINDVASRVDLPVDATIANDGPWDDDAMARRLRDLLVAIGAR